MQNTETNTETPGLSSSQTIGPFPHEAWAWAVHGPATHPPSATLCLQGRLLDGQGRPIDDGWIEAWTPLAQALEQQAGYPLPGFCRVPTDGEGGFTLWLSPSAVPGEPLALITVFARGLLLHRFSAVFAADDAGLSASSLLNQVPAARRPSLLAQSVAEAPGHYRWDIRLQGEPQSETVFFDYA